MASKTIRDIEAQLALREQQLVVLQADVEALRRARDILLEVEQQDDVEEVPQAKLIRNTMVAILQEAGQPMHYGDIYESLLNRGIAVPGKDPRRNVGAHLSIDDRFEKKGGGLWSLRTQSRKDDGFPWLSGSYSRQTRDSDMDAEDEYRDTVDPEREPSTDELRAYAKENFDSIFIMDETGPALATVPKRSSGASSGTLPDY